MFIINCKSFVAKNSLIFVIKISITTIIFTFNSIDIKVLCVCVLERWFFGLFDFY